MKWGFLNLFKKAQSSRGASSAEYALCCALLCVFVVGSIGSVSKGINASFGSFQDSPALASIFCPTCSLGGGGGRSGGPEQVTEGQTDDNGGGSVSTERPPVTVEWADTSETPPPPPDNEPIPVETGTVEGPARGR